jgi:hypothetical protein
LRRAPDDVSKTTVDLGAGLGGDGKRFRLGKLLRKTGAAALVNSCWLLGQRENRFRNVAEWSLPSFQVGLAFHRHAVGEILIHFAGNELEPEASMSFWNRSLITNGVSLALLTKYRIPWASLTSRTLTPLGKESALNLRE